MKKQKKLILITFVFMVSIFLVYGQDDNVPLLPDGIDPVMDGAFSDSLEYQNAFKDSGYVDPDGAVSTYYMVQDTAWIPQFEKDPIPNRTLFITNDLYGMQSTDDDANYNTVEVTVTRPDSTVDTLKVWNFYGDDSADDTWLSQNSDLSDYSAPFDDRGFLVRKNGDPQSDVHWLPGDPVPGDNDWDGEDTYYCFAASGWNNSAIEHGYRTTPSGPNMVYEWVFMNYQEITETKYSEKSDRDCIIIIWYRIIDPRESWLPPQIIRVDIICFDPPEPDPPSPVELSSFTAVCDNGSSLLQWSTASESDNQGWNIYRGEFDYAHELDETFKVNNNLVDGAGTTSLPTHYSFTDQNNLESNNTYWYWLECVDYSGDTEIYGPISLTIEQEEPDELPEKTMLIGNYPNPFKPVTNIKFNIRKESRAILTIVNTKGQVVERVEFEQGYHNYEWNAENVSSGVYFYKLESENYNETKKMILLK